MVSWASAASVEVDTAGSKIEALEGEEWTSAFSICPTITLGPGDGRNLPAGLSIFSCDVVWSGLKHDVFELSPFTKRSRLAATAPQRRSRSPRCCSNCAA